MLLDLYNTTIAIRDNDINFQTPSPFDHLEKDYIYTSEGKPYCRNLPYNSWYVTKFKHKEKTESLGSCWEEYIQDQVYFLRYNNPEIIKLAVGIVINFMKSWGINKKILKDKELSEHVSELYDSYPKDWEPKDRARHWYSPTIERMPKAEGENSDEYNKRKLSIKAKLRSNEQDIANQELIKTASLDYQTQKHGLVPTVDILKERAQKSLYLIKKLGEENEDWQRKGAFTEQCINLALDLNPHFTQKELAEMVSLELPDGKMSERGIKAAIKRIKVLQD